MFKLDAVIIGAGVIGLAIARAFALRGREVMVVDRERAPGMGTSSRNSEVIHAGLYYAPGSLKARFCVAGRRLLYDYCKARNIPHRNCGKLIVATAPSEQERLAALFERARANGVEEIEPLGRGQIAALEPDLNATEALLSGTTGIVDGHALMQAYQADAESAGANFAFATPVLEAAIAGDRVMLRIGGTEGAEIEAQLVINAAGLDAWDVSRRISGLDASTIPPRHLAKGTYFALSGTKAPFTHLIYPLPVAGGLGVHLTLDLAGKARFGPDVEWTDAIDYAVDAARGIGFYEAIRRYWPALPDGALVPDYCGIRPKTSRDGESDFVIQGPAETGHGAYVALYGIESPGLTASLAIAEHVADLVSA